MKHITFLFTVSLILASCSNDKLKTKANSGSYDIPDAALRIDNEIELEPPRTAEPPSPGTGISNVEMIIKTGKMSIEVEDLSLAKEYADSLIVKSEAYYENENYRAYGDWHSYDLTLRVPVSGYDALITNLTNRLGTLLSKNISALNVTEEYLDLKIRLENKLAYLEQYRSLLTKAESIKEILEVQDHIRRIEEEIESKKGRLKYLESQVALSTLHLVLRSHNKATADMPGYGEKLKKALKRGLSFIRESSLIMVSLWPALVLLTILWYWRKFIIKRKKKTT